MTMPAYVPHYLKHLKVKEYPNGYKGSYICDCSICGKQFFGDKRDKVCPDCVK